MWWKMNRWKIIVPILVVAVLAAAFWYGGGGPEMQGWRVLQSEEDPVLSEEDSPAPPVGTAASDQPAPSKQLDVAEPENIEPENIGPDSADAEAPATVPAPDADKDPYLTEPVPEGKPLPVEPQDTEIVDTAYTCTLSISCASILDHMDWLDPEKTELVPENGWILEPVEVTFYEGESVFNVLQRTCKQQKIHMEFSNTPMYNSAYIEGIHNLYEFDCGELSGWMYQVNGWFPNYGCSRYVLEDGDVVCWEYTCDLGADVRGQYVTGG